MWVIVDGWPALASFFFFFFHSLICGFGWSMERQGGGGWVFADLVVVWVAGGLVVVWFCEILKIPSFCRNILLFFFLFFFCIFRIQTRFYKMKIFSIKYFSCKIFYLYKYFTSKQTECKSINTLTIMKSNDLKILFFIIVQVTCYNLCIINKCMLWYDHVKVMLNHLLLDIYKL